MTRNWGKQYQSATLRLKKGGKVAADQAILDAEREKRIMEEAKKKKAEALKQQKSTKGDVTMNTTEITSLIVNTMTEMFQQNRERELGMQIRLQEARNAEVQMRNERVALEQDTIANLQDFMQQMSTMESRIVDRLMGDKVKLAEIELKKLELQVELARIKVAAINEPVEFELTPFINPRAGKVEEITLEGKVEEVAKPKRTRRAKAKAKVVTEVIPTGVTEVIETGVTEDVDCLVPAKYIRESSGRINWKLVDEDNMFLNIVASIVGDAAEKGINVVNGNEFRKFSKLAGGAYQRFMDVNKGIKGSWKAFMMEIGAK